MTRFLIIIISFLYSFNAISQKMRSASSDTIGNNRLQDVEVISRVKLTSKIRVSTEASASPASVTLLGRDYIARQAITSYGDLLRPIAGVAVANYQLGGVGYGIQMRGYTVSEHARDVAFSIDGVPQNQGSSIQTNGFVDLRMLIPENIKRLEVIRGPFSPFYGDHALGGSISFETMDKMPSTITVSGGLYGSARVLGTVGFGKNKQSGYISLEASNNDDYRNNNSQRLLNGFAKYTFPLGKGTASVRAQGYGQNFHTAGYILRSEVDSGIISKKSSVSNTDGGSTRQQNLVFNYKDNDSTNFNSITAYVQHHDFIRVRTNTAGGPQRQDRDNRVWAGADLRHTLIKTLGLMPVLYAVGLSFRADDIDNNRFSTRDGQKIAQTQDRQIKTYTPGIYAQKEHLMRFTFLQEVNFALPRNPR
jgi:outer membrane receptor protein involved in Fe transport